MGQRFNPITGELLNSERSSTSVGGGARTGYNNLLLDMKSEDMRGRNSYNRYNSMTKEAKRRPYKNDSTNVDRIFAEQEELLYYPNMKPAAKPASAAKNYRSIEVNGPLDAYLRVGNPKNWDQLEEVFEQKHLAIDPVSYFETVKQKPLSPESIKVKHMTRYNRFHN
jgi:hypothetical protein